MNKFQIGDCVLVTDQRPYIKGKVVSVKPVDKGDIMLYEVSADEWRYPSFVAESRLQHCEDKQ